MTTLDDIQSIKSLDKSNMAGFILEMPEQIEDSLKKVKKLKVPEEWMTSPKGGKKKVGMNFKNICLCGMGGSAVANHLVTNLSWNDRKLPMQMVRGYEVPAWVDENSLVILTSHSGQTQETISAFKDAAAAKAKIFVVAERGKLEKLGAKQGGVVFDYDTQAAPRASLGYQFGAVFGMLNKLKIINYKIEPGLKILRDLNKELPPEVPVENRPQGDPAELRGNLAKNIAYGCFDRLPVVIGSGILKSVVWRWKTQFNENAKQLAFTEFLPEAMHNAIQGMDWPKHCQEDLIYLILQNSFDPKELVNQFEKFKNVLDKKNIKYEIIEPVGKDVFSQKLSLVLLGDWVSFYLAMLNGVDPTPVETIKKAK